MSNTESAVAPIVKQDDVSGIICPRLYQVELLEEAKRRNIIIRADTGTGKTLVAVLLIQWMAAQPKADSQRHVLQAFLVPTRPLVQQQAKAIRAGTNLRVREYTGDLQPELWKVDKWHNELQEADVIVCTAQVFYNILSKGFWSLENVSLMVFDEAHHCRKNHVYNQIMQVHFRRLTQDSNQRRVPKILGLTASPIWGCKDIELAEMDVKALQSELCAQLYEIKEARHDLMQYTNKPKEKTVYYARSTFIDPLLDPHWKRVRALVDSHADSKFIELSRAVQEELGQYAQLLFISDWLASLLSLPTNKKTMNTINPRLLEPTYIRRVEEAVKSLNSRIDPNDVPSSQTTPKFQALIRILEQYARSDVDANFQGMIFVERRMHAKLLHRLISRCAVLKGFIKSGALTGHASTGLSNSCDSGMGSNAQRRAVEKFRRGEINLAIATDVAEEGLDFRACRVVIRFDDLKSWKGYIQSRGRARVADSDYIVMLAEGKSSQYCQFVGKELVMRCINLKELEANLYDRPENEVIDEAEAESTPQLINALGGGKDAIITHNAAVSLLNEVCQLVAHDEYAEIPKAHFEDICRPDGFVCRVTLPPMLALPPSHRVFESDPYPKKRAAKQSACFKACHALRRAGVLDERFMPQRERHKASATDADGRDLTITLLPEKVDVICPNPFGSVRTPSSEVWLHKLSFDLGEPKPSTFGFLCAQKLVLPAGLVIQDHFQGGKSLPIVIESTVKTSWTQEERSENLAKLEAFTRLGMQAAVNRRAYEGDLLFFVAALKEGTTEIDWNLIENPLTPITSLDDLPKYNEIIVPLSCLHHRIFTSHFLCPDLTAQSRPDEVPPHPNLHRFIRNAKRFKSLGHFYSILADSLRGQLTSPLIYLESNFAPKDVLMKEFVAKPRLPFRVLLPFAACKGSQLPAYFWRIFSFLPGLTRRMHDAKQVGDVLERLSVPHVSLDLAIEALTPPGLAVPCDYQTLETVGDAFLKLATSVHIYLFHVKKGEGDMSALRSKSVDNEYLRSKLLQAGLAGYILSHRYRTDRFKAAHMDEGHVLANGAFQRKIHRRVLSDVAEALLGAGYLSGGISTALKIGTTLDLCFGGTVPWSERPCTVFFDANNNGSTYQLKESQIALQQLIGYTFKEPLLLIQALTHRSSGSFLTNCYEREEWLGDAIIDFWITEHCYRRWENATAAQLTLTRACLVTNASLGYLALKKLGLRGLILHDSRHFEQACDEAMKEIANFPDIGSFYEDLNNSFVVFDPPKILGDALEALVGAMFIDCGLDLQVVYKSLDKIYEDVLPCLKQIEPLDPLSCLLRLRDKHGCAQVRRVSRHAAEKTGADDEICQSLRICDVTFHGQLIATGQHLTSPSVAEQRACLSAYEVLSRESNEEGPDTGPGLWKKCNCQAFLECARAASKAKETEEKVPSPSKGKANKKKRAKQNRRLRAEHSFNAAAAAAFSQPVGPANGGELLDEDAVTADKPYISDLSDAELCAEIAEKSNEVVSSGNTFEGEDFKPTCKTHEGDSPKAGCVIEVNCHTDGEDDPESSEIPSKLLQSGPKKRKKVGRAESCKSLEQKPRKKVKVE